MASQSTPSTIAGYRVLERLGSGATSEVFLAVDDEAPAGAGKQVALKLLLLQVGSEHERFAQLKRELAAYRAIESSSIVRLEDAFAVDEQCVLALEYVAGPSLESVLEWLGPGERLPDGVILYVMGQVFGALAAAHAVVRGGELASVVHGEMRRSNVLFSWDGDVKLADFGVTKIFHGSDGKAFTPLRSASSYVAPEEAKGEDPSPKSDVYAASLLFWELFSAHVPEHRRARTPGELAAALREPQLPSLALLRPDLPRAISELLTRGLEPDPAKRRLTAREVTTSLARLPLEQGKARMVAILAGRRPGPKVPAGGSLPPESLPRDTVREPGVMDRDSMFPEVNEGPASAFRAMGTAGEPARRRERKPEERRSTYPSFGPETEEERAWDSLGPPEPASPPEADEEPNRGGAAASEGGPDAQEVSPSSAPVEELSPDALQSVAPPPAVPTPSAPRVAANASVADAPSRATARWVGAAFVGAVVLVLVLARTRGEPPGAPTSPEARRAASASTPLGAPPSSPPPSGATEEPAPSAASPVATGTSTTSASDPIAVGASTASAPPPVASAPVPVASAPSVPDAPPNGVPDTPPPAGMGDLRTTARAKSHRVFVDGKVIGEGEGVFRVACGTRKVRVGSAREDETIQVPCGGEVTVR